MIGLIFVFLTLIFWAAGATILICLKILCKAASTAVSLPFRLLKLILTLLGIFLFLIPILYYGPILVFLSRFF